MTMRWRELIETKHAVPARCQVHRRCAAHGPKADDDNSAHCPPEVIRLSGISFDSAAPISCVRSKAGFLATAACAIAFVVQNRIALASRHPER
jgi:hypothetical protein